MKAGEVDHPRDCRRGEQRVRDSGGEGKQALNQSPGEEVAEQRFIQELVAHTAGKAKQTASRTRLSLSHRRRSLLSSLTSPPST